MNKVIKLVNRKTTKVKMSNNMYAYSVYIPMIPAIITAEILEEEFLFVCAVVERVDFTPINKKPGFEEDVTGDIVSAFVHFSECPNEIPIVISERGCYHYYPHSLGGRFTERLRFWKLLPVLAPVQKTMMNNAQIVANCRNLEEKVKAQEKTIQKLEKSVSQIMEFIRSGPASMDEGVVNNRDVNEDRITKLEFSVNNLMDFIRSDPRL